MSATESSIETVRVAAKAAADKLATDIIGLDVSERLAITDAFLIASAANERQVTAIVDAVEEALAKEGLKPVRREGRAEGRWVLLDYAEVVIHIQHVEDRIFYALDRLWNDCPRIDLNLDEASRAQEAPDGGARVGAAANGTAADSK